MQMPPADVLALGDLHHLPLLYEGSARWVEASAPLGWLIAVDCHLAPFSFQALPLLGATRLIFLKVKPGVAPAWGGVPDCQWRNI